MMVNLKQEQDGHRSRTRNAMGDVKDNSMLAPNMIVNIDLQK